MAFGDPHELRGDGARAPCLPDARGYRRWRYNALDMVSPIRA